MRYAIGLEYDGSEFFGWQIQRQEPTVQGCLEAALARVADQEVRAICCGRTDTGVHALGQVAHFESGRRRERERDWVLGLNSHLPAGVSVLWIRQVDESFHARFSAFSRTYRYLVLNRWIRPALEARRMSWCRLPLDAARMHEAAQALRGEHDFTSFRAGRLPGPACRARNPRHLGAAVRAMSLSLEVTANGFLYHMVRNIAGTLLRVGQGEAEVAWPGQVCSSERDRSKAAPTAAPEGLYFVRARYPDHYELPANGPGVSRGAGICREPGAACGLKSAESRGRKMLQAAVAAGADALGFVFAPRSRRVLDPERAAGTGAPACRRSFARVGLFMDQDFEEVRRILESGAAESAAVPRQRRCRPSAAGSACLTSRPWRWAQRRRCSRPQREFCRCSRPCCWTATGPAKPAAPGRPSTGALHSVP